MKAANLASAACVVFCALSLGCTSGAPPVASTERVQSALTIPTPTLTAHPGLLCFTGGDYTPPPPTGFDGWVSTTVPQSRAVLGGSGLGGGMMIANTALTFQVTALSDSLQWGDRQEVCAEASAVSSCTTLLACWSGSGTGTIELSSSPQCDPSVPPTRTVYATTSLPPLTAGTTSYNISLLWFLDSHQVDAMFFVNGNLVALPTTNHIGVFSPVGFGGYRANRVQMKAMVTAEPANEGANIQTTSVGRAGQQFPDGTELGCSYLSPPPMALNGYVQQIATWQNPPGITPGAYLVYTDGRQLDGSFTPLLGVFAGGGGLFTYGIPGLAYLVNHRTHFQVAYVDGSGNFSEAADALAPAKVPPVSPLVADGTLNLGVVLLYYADSLTPTQGFNQHRVNLSSKIFNPTPGAYSLANYVHEASAGHANVTGAISRWIQLKDSNGNPLSLATDCVGHPAGDPTTWTTCNFGSPNSDPVQTLTAQARAAGFPVDSYEQLVFFVAGLNAGESNMILGDYGLSMTDPDGLPNLHILAHELGHVIGFSHTYAEVCPGANLDGIRDNNCPAVGGASATTGFPISFDAQTSTARHLSDWNSLYQYAEGWLTDAEVAYANAGTPDTTYTLAPLTASNAGTRQIRVELEPGVFYFAEYRDGSGFQGPGPFDNRVAYGNSTATEEIYRSEVGVTIWFKPPRQLINFFDPDVVASSLGAGDYYCDPIRQVAIHVLSLGPTASVRVQRGPCVAPSLDPTCPIDGQKDGSETGIDCGGPCTPCGMNFGCHTAADCASGFCGPNGNCLAPTCGDGVKDGSETDVDCGGVACVTCAGSKVCKVDTDCQSALCVEGIGFTCAAP